MPGGIMPGKGNTSPVPGAPQDQMAQLANLFAAARPPQGGGTGGAAPMAPIQQPTAPARPTMPTAPAQPVPTQTPFARPAARQSDNPLMRMADERAAGEGFRDSADQQGWLASLNGNQRRLYNSPDIRQSGSSIHSPTDMPWSVQDPSMVSSMARWQMQNSQPQAPAAPPPVSQSQQMAQAINAAAQARQQPAPAPMAAGAAPAPAPGGNDQLAMLLRQYFTGAGR